MGRSNGSRVSGARKCSDRRPTLSADFHQLVDLRDVTNVHLTASGIRELVSLNPFGAGAQPPVVVTNSVAFGMARMYQFVGRFARRAADLSENG